MKVETCLQPINCHCGQPAIAIVCGEEGFPVCIDHFEVADAQVCLHGLVQGDKCLILPYRSVVTSPDKAA